MNQIKKYGRLLLCAIMERQVVALRKRKRFKVVAVAGSVGKTSTKLSIAAALGEYKAVRHQAGNYNDRLTVPLVIFGHENPGLFAVHKWLKILVSNHFQIFGTFPYDVVVVELGTDGPGQIREFAYLLPELSVVTAATPEHMEFFGTVEAVAKEELTVSEFSDLLLINIDDVPSSSLQKVKNYKSFATFNEADYKITRSKNSKILPQDISINYGGKKFTSKIELMGGQGCKIALAAFAAAVELGIDPAQAASSLGILRPFSGRMRLLDGIKGSTIIDDSYNASPAAVRAALDVLYAVDSPQRIAILGNMNELGDTSKQSHTEMGEWCDPKKLDLVVVIGPDAEKYTAPAAAANGCKVESFKSPYQAGKFVKEQLKPGAVILVKGSQNRVFAEEAIKYLLKNPADKESLVRQSDYWLGIKLNQFPDGEGIA